MKICVLGCGIGSVATLYYLWKFRNKLPIDEIVVYGINCDKCRCACGVQKWKLDLVKFEIYKKFIISDIERAIIDFKIDDFSKTLEVKSRGVFSGCVIDREKLQSEIINEFLSKNFIKFYNEYVTIHRVKEFVKRFDFIINTTSLSLVDLEDDHFDAYIGNIAKTSLYVCTQGVAQRGKNFEENTIYMFFRKYIPFGYAWVFPWRENTVHIGVGVHKYFNVNVHDLLRRFVKECLELKLINNDNIQNVVTKTIPCFNTSYLFEITYITFEELQELNKLPITFLIVVKNFEERHRIVNIGDSIGLVDQLTGAGIANTVITSWAFTKSLTEVHKYCESKEFYDTVLHSLILNKISWLLKDLNNRFNIVKYLVERVHDTGKRLKILYVVFEKSCRLINSLGKLPIPKTLLKFIIPKVSNKLFEEVRTIDH